MTNYPKGSEWRRWDLHVHTPLSYENQFSNWVAYIDKLKEKAVFHNIQVAGINDYFSVDGYEKLLYECEDETVKITPRIKLSNDKWLYLFPVVELRLENFTSDNESVNIHVVFSPDILPSTIRSSFLENLEIKYQSLNLKCKVDDLIKIGYAEENNGRFDVNMDLGSISDTDKNHLIRNALKIVSFSSSIFEDGIDRFQKILKESGIEDDKYLIIIANKGRGGLDAFHWHDKLKDLSRAGNIRQNLLNLSDMCFSNDDNDIQFLLGEKDDTSKEEILNRFRSFKPCIWGSDAQTEENLFHPSNGNTNDYTWIKADPTFEGFQQVLYEPEERVAIQQNDPSPVISNYTITQIRIGGAAVNDELSLADTDFEFNPFLVAVIGGKGAGKTALVDLIANCYVDRVATDDKNSFVKRIAEYEPQIITSLSFRDGGEFTKNLCEEKFYEDGQIIYIAQGELEKYIGEKSDLHQRIRELIFDSPKIKNSILSYDFYEAIVTTEKLDKILDTKNHAIESLDVKTSEDNSRTIEKEKTRIKADLKDIGKRIKELEKVQDKSDTEAAEKKQEKLGALKTRQKNLSVLRFTLEKAIEFLENQLSDFNRLIRVANELMKQLKIEEEKFPELSYSDKTKLEKLVGLVKTQIKQTVSEIEGEQNELEKLKLSVKKHARLLERRRELQTMLKAVDEKAKQFEEDKKKLQQTEIERKKLMTELLLSVIAQKKQYEKIIKTFSDEKAEVLSDIDFIAEVRFDDVDFLKKAENIIDNRKVAVMGDDNNPPAFDTLIKLARAVAYGNEFKVDELIEEIERCNKEFKTKIKSDPVTTGHFYDLFYRNYMQVIPVVKYKKTYLEKLSLGQKATVLIKIYLAHGDKPIIIDSHDDHLDNEFIMDELVKAIRQAKSYRQVILVSNNGNVVINSDAEQIVIANRHDEKITYISGAIENPAIRDRALKVLEGGSEAFRKRQQKYRLGS